MRLTVPHSLEQAFPPHTLLTLSAHLVRLLVLFPPKSLLPVYAAFLTHPPAGSSLLPYTYPLFSTSATSISTPPPTRRRQPELQAQGVSHQCAAQRVLHQCIV